MGMLFQGKKIILLVPKHYRLDLFLQKELENLGFEVHNLSFFDNTFQYRNFAQRLSSFIHKNVLGDRHYKNKLKFKEAERSLSERLSALTDIDYALVIRADVLPLTFIEKLKKKCRKTVAYQWDGLQRFPDIYARIPLFDRFFIFDNQDQAQPGVLPTTNFYSQQPTSRNTQYTTDLYYVGSYAKNRIPVLEAIQGIMLELGLTIKLHVFSVKSHVASFPLTHSALIYEDNLLYTLNSTTLLDITNPQHKGLSFRTFEAIGFHKKLITTNTEIDKYDFYHPNNIFIWGKDDPNSLKDFFQQPYAPLDSAIHQKYAFQNWIKYLLDESDYQPITLPS